MAYVALAFVSLFSGWYFDKPREYMVIHGMWHVFGAAAGLELANAHQAISSVAGM